MTAVKKKKSNSGDMSLRDKKRIGKRLEVTFLHL